MTKPGFINKRLILLFESEKNEDIIKQQEIVDNYNKIRRNECYCGHTNVCDCENPGISEFKSSLYTYSIPEFILDKL
jgi:hypothetical protein